MTDPNHIAEAYVTVATTNHYLVAVAHQGCSLDELRAAEQILITEQNNLCEGLPLWAVYDLALNQLAHDMQQPHTKAA